MKLIALMGKAGSGKDTILNTILDLYPEKFNKIVSCTTRPPREGEQNGIDYYFIDVEEFTNRLLGNDMLEVTQFNGWFYGTMVSSLSEDKINIGVFNPEGVDNIQHTYLNIDTTTFYIQANDKIRLLRQLNREENPNVHEIIRRFSADEKDFLDIKDLDFIAINNNGYTPLNIIAYNIAEGKYS